MDTKYVLTEEQVEEFKKIAQRKCWSDDPDFMVDDYAGGNIDDAFYGGECDGEIQLARNLMTLLDVDFVVGAE